MKRWIKYLISTIIFGIVYTLVEYLLNKSINWKMVIVTTITYAIFYTTIDLISNKTNK